MLINLRKSIAAVLLGLSVSTFSSTALSAGPVTFMWYEAEFYTLLVTAGGVTCGVQTQNVAPEKIAGAVAMLAAAKANGVDVSLNCSFSALQVSM